MSKKFIVPFDKKRASSYLILLPVVIALYALSFWFVLNLKSVLRDNSIILVGILGGILWGLRNQLNYKIIVGLGGLASIYFFIPEVVDYYIIALELLLKLIIFALSVIVLLGGIYTYFQIKNDEPLAIVSCQGLWIRHRGFIAWDDISECKPYIYKNSPISMIGIQLKTPNKIFKQSTFTGKSGIFWSKIFGYPHIIIETNDQILSFANKFLS